MNLSWCQASNELTKIMSIIIERLLHSEGGHVPGPSSLQHLHAVCDVFLAAPVTAHLAASSSHLCSTPAECLEWWQSTLLHHTPGPFVDQDHKHSYKYFECSPSAVLWNARQVLCWCFKRESIFDLKHWNSCPTSALACGFSSIETTLRFENLLRKFCTSL